MLYAAPIGRGSWGEGGKLLFYQNIMKAFLQHLNYITSTALRSHPQILCVLLWCYQVPKYEH